MSVPGAPARAKLARLAAAVVSLAALASPGQAEAAAQTYCVHQGGSCPAGQIDVGAELQQALNFASANSGSTVLIGAGIYSRAGGFEYTAGTDITINGAGAGQTILQETAPFSNPVLKLTASGASTLTGLTVDLTHGVVDGLALSGATASGIAVTLEPEPTTFPRGADVFGGATIAHSTIAGATAVDASASGSATLVDDTLSGLAGLSVAGGEDVTADDLRISSEGIALSASGSGTSVVADGLLALVGGTSPVVAVTATNGASMTVRSATIVETGAANDIGVGSFANSDHTSMLMSDSIVSGFPIADRRTASGASPLADLTLNNDDMSLAADSGDPGSYQHNNDIEANPLFVNPATSDYHLPFGSPAIDAGGACNTICQTVPDLDGLTRPIDGNGDGLAVRDMGAYEYGHRPPLAAASAAPGASLTGAGVTFNAAGSSDPDDGDTLSYAWTFDDGTAAAGPTVTHSFTTPGTHVGTIVVTDPSGLTSTASASVLVSAPAPAPAKDTTPPTVSSLRLSPDTFAIGKGRTATIAGAKPKRHHQGTDIEFQLSEPAKVVIAFARSATGVKVGRSCVAPSHKRPHGKPCGRYLAAGSLTRRAEPAGKVSIRFSGRLGGKALAPGRYRLTLTATDASGNASKPRTATFTVAAR